MVGQSVIGFPGQIDAAEIRSVGSCTVVVLRCIFAGRTKA